MAATIPLKTFLSKYLYLARRPCALCLRDQYSAAGDGGSKRYMSNGKEIVLPKKVKRDSLTVLKALAGTVKRDPTRQHYSILDDPQITNSVPIGPFIKKRYVLAKDSGRKTARYMANLYRDAFENDAGQPRVKAFDIEPLYSCTTLGEVALKERIELRKVVHAVEIYKKMVAQDMEVSEPVLLSFLELLCVFSEFDPPERRFQEENLYESELVDTDVGKITWKNNGLAEKIFDSLHEKTEQCYNWMLKGYCKFDESKKAFDLYEEMKIEDVKVDISGYHGLLLQSGAGFSKAEATFNTIKDLWTAMQADDYPPSLEMFNCSLKALPGTSSKEQASAILAEMIAVGIGADCVTLGQVLRCCYEPEDTEDKRSDDRVTAHHLYIVNDLLNYIYKNSVNIDSYDADTFFYIAMEICRYGRNAKLAQKVYDLLETKTVQEIFTKPQREFSFFNSYMTVLLDIEDLQVAMKAYEKIVPSLHVPRQFIRRLILQKIKRTRSYEYIPMISSEYWSSASFCMDLFDTMANAQCSMKLKEEFFQLVDDVFRLKWLSKLPYGFRRSQQDMRWINGELISHGMQIAINVDKLETAQKYLTTFYDNKSIITGDVSDRTMDKLVDAFIEKQNHFYATELMETINMWCELVNDDAASLLYSKMPKLPAVLHPHQLDKVIKA